MTGADIALGVLFACVVGVVVATFAEAVERSLLRWLQRRATQRDIDRLARRVWRVR